MKGASTKLNFESPIDKSVWMIQQVLLCFRIPPLWSTSQTDDTSHRIHPNIVWLLQAPFDFLFSQSIKLSFIWYICRLIVGQVGLPLMELRPHGIHLATKIYLSVGFIPYTIHDSNLEWMLTSILWDLFQIHMKLPYRKIL